MNNQFSKNLKQIRKNHNLSQEQLADEIGVSRQAISNWENKRNLPDIEMLIIISKIFSISLDELILGGEEMNDIERKLINDGSESRIVKMNLISTIIGTFLLLIGLLCIVIKANTIEYIDESGILHENFYLLPIGFLFIFIGLIVILVGIIRYIKKRKQF